MFGTVDTWIAWTLSGVLDVIDASNAGVTGMLLADGSGWSPKVLDALRIPEAMLPEVPTPRGELGEAQVLEGAPVIAGLAETSRPPSSARAAPGPGRRRPPSAPAGCSTSAWARTRLPARPGGQAGTIPIIAWRRMSTTTWGLEAIMLSAGTCVEWLRDDLGVIDLAEHRPSWPRRYPVDDTGDVWFVPALLGLGTPVWDFGARGTLLGLTRGSGRPELRACRARGGGHPRRPPLFRRVRLGHAGRLAAHRRRHVAEPGIHPRLAEACAWPIEIAPVLEATTLGAAFLAGMAVGVWSDEDDVADWCTCWSSSRPPRRAPTRLHGPARQCRARAERQPRPARPTSRTRARGETFRTGPR